MCRYRAVVLVVGIILLLVGNIRAAVPTPLPTIVAPQGKLVNSDYGPRDAALSYATKFHQGIDYGFAFGEKIPLLETGEILFIRKDGIGRWRLEVSNINRSTNLNLRYLHLYVNQDPPIHIKNENEYWSLIVKQTATGERLFIIRWADPYYLGARAQYIIGPGDPVKIERSEVAFDHYYVWDNNPEVHTSVPVDFTVTPTLTPDPSATPTSTPSQYYIVNEDSSAELESINLLDFNNVPFIGPAGDSGTLGNDGKTHPHLHIDFANELINPFYYMHHFDESNPDCKNDNADFKIKLTGPRNSSDEPPEKDNEYWIESNKPESAFLRVVVDSYARKDLDRIVIYLTGKNKNGNVNGDVVILPR